MYAILVNADDGHLMGIESLAMANRKKRQDHWWLSDSPEDIMCFKSFRVAKRQLMRLKHKNPRIVDFNFAKEKIKEQRESIQQYKNNC